MIGGLGSAVAELIAEARIVMTGRFPSGSAESVFRTCSPTNTAPRPVSWSVTSITGERVCALVRQLVGVNLPFRENIVGRLLNIVTPLHKRAKRDCLARMVDDKVHCMVKAKEYEFDYWDGDRRYGYGGYKYDGRWKVVAEKLIAHLPSCPGRQDSRRRLRQGPLLYELQQLLPQSSCVGFDVSRHGLADAPRASAATSSATGPRTPIPSATSTSIWSSPGLPAQPADLRVEDGPAGNRARGQERLRHAGKLPQRAGDVQPAVLGLDLPNRSSTPPSGSGCTTTSATRAITNSSTSE